MLSIPPHSGTSLQAVAMRSQPPHAEGERAAAPSATHLREALQQIREVHYREAHQVRVRNGSARGTDGSTTTATAAASIATSASRTAGDALEERLHQLPQGPVSYTHLTLPTNREV